MKISNYFQNLNYTLGDEDSIVEFELLQERVNHLVAIAGSGGRILPLIAKAPKQITCIDILDEQLYITELRVEALKALNFIEFRSFLGYPPIVMASEERKRIFEALDLSLNAKIYLRQLFDKHNWSEIIYMGKFENTMATLSKINYLITGKKGRAIFNAKNLGDQQEYYTNQFPHYRWRAILFLLGNSSVLNTLLYKGDFPKKNIAGSYYNNFKNIYDSIFKKIWINTSFFAHLSFWGKVVNADGNPLEVNEKVFLKAKKNLSRCKISYLREDIIKFISNSPKNSIDFISLSDVPSFMKEYEDNYLQLIKPSLSENGTVVVRGNLRITNPIATGFTNLKEKHSELLARETTQLWKMDIYQPCLQTE